MSKQQPKMHYLKDYCPADFIVETIHLHFDLHEEYSIVKSILHLQRNPQSANQKAPLLLNGEDLQLQEILLDGQALSDHHYSIDKHHLTIEHVPDKFILETKVLIKPQENTQLMGLYKSRQNFCTQCEAQGFRRITYYLDRPDVMTKFITTITADKTKYPFLLSNGNLIETRDLSDNRHWVHWEDPSLKPCYLFALVAGDFDLLEDEFITLSGRKVQLKLYLEKGYLEQGDFAMQSLKRAMKWDEERWGREYDLDIYMTVAVSDFNMGAMENKGLNIFNTKYILAKPETATDMDYVYIEDVIGHEYFHNWSGNRVTVRNWFQITLKEGLTVFRDQSFSEDMTDKSVARINEVNIVRNNQFPEDASPLAHPIRPEEYLEINNFYTMTVYRKGAEVIRMLETLLGKAVFRQAMDLYFSRHDGQAVQTEDFVQAMEDASGRDLSQFKRWYHQAGTPVLDVTGQYDESQQTFTLVVKQSCPATPGQAKKEPFHLPLLMGLVGESGKELPIQLDTDPKAQIGSRVLEIKKSQETFTFINMTEKPVPSLLRNFSAPVKLNYPYSNQELAWLMQYDSDPVSRWDAAQQLASQVILKLAQAEQAGETLTVDEILMSAFQQVLMTPEADLNIIAQLITLPSVGYLLANGKEHDVAAIFKARQFVQLTLANANIELLRQVYEQHQITGSYEYNVVNMGKRSLKNICLMYLAFTGNEEFVKLALQQFSSANNMTDTMGALVALNNVDCNERGIALQEFYEKWQQELLVINKWLQLQSTSTLPNTLQNVRELLNHPAYDQKNPNKVYALLCGFGANVVRFHDSKGEAYKFVADQVLAIDKENPQVAARVLQPLTRWQQVDHHRAELMKMQLQRIATMPEISSDIYEMASKSIN